MAEARSKAEWGRTASGMAMLANIHRDPKRHRVYVPDDFNPHARPRARRFKVGLEVLATIFCKKRK